MSVSSSSGVPPSSPSPLEAGGNIKHAPQSSTSQNGQSNPRRVSSTASSQHKHEQELLSGFTVPAPPVSTTESTLAAGHETENAYSATPEPPRTLWMGDLDPWLDELGIVDLWWQVLAQHVSVKLIRPRPGRLAHPESQSSVHCGYCFVEFPSFETAQQALGLNGQLLPDIAMPSQQQYPDNPDNQKKYFRLNWASGATLTAPIIESPEYSLFVGDLSASTTEAHLLSFFQKSFPDSIRTVRVMTDPVTGKSRCFGFVRFSDELERQRALVEMDGVWFGGRPLRVANATPRAAPMYRKHVADIRQGAYVAGPHFSANPDMSPNELMYAAAQPGGYYTSPLIGSGEMGYATMPQNVPLNVSGPHYVDPANTTVFVGGLSSDVTDQTLYTLFKPFGSIIQIKVPPGKNCGFVKYATREEAEDAILNMEGFVIGGHRVRLGWGRISAANKKLARHPQISHLQMQAMSLGYDPQSVYGASQGYPGQMAPPPTASGATQVYAPMAMPMFPYATNSELPPDFDHAGVSEYNVAGSPPIIRSRSLDHEIDGATSVGYHLTAGDYASNQLAHNFDTLSLDAVADYQSHGQGTFIPYSAYVQADQHNSSSSASFPNQVSPVVTQSSSSVANLNERPPGDSGKPTSVNSADASDGSGPKKQNSSA